MWRGDAKSRETTILSEMGVRERSEIVSHLACGSRRLNGRIVCGECVLQFSSLRKAPANWVGH